MHPRRPIRARTPERLHGFQSPVPRRCLPAVARRFWFRTIMLLFGTTILDVFLPIRLESSFAVTTTLLQRQRKFSPISISRARGLRLPLPPFFSWSPQKVRHHGYRQSDVGWGGSELRVRGRFVRMPSRSPEKGE